MILECCHYITHSPFETIYDFISYILANNTYSKTRPYLQTVPLNADK